MYASRKCQIRHICYYANICNRVAPTNTPCELQKSRELQTYNTTEPTDLHPYTKEQDYIADIRRRYQLGFDELSNMKEVNTQ